MQEAKVLGSCLPSSVQSKGSPELGLLAGREAVCHLCTGRVPFMGQPWERNRVCIEMENSSSN